MQLLCTDGETEAQGALQPQGWCVFLVGVTLEGQALPTHKHAPSPHSWEGMDWGPVSWACHGPAAVLQGLGLPPPVHLLAGAGVQGAGIAWDETTFCVCASGSWAPQACLR